MTSTLTTPHVPTRTYVRDAIAAERDYAGGVHQPGVCNQRIADLPEASGYGMCSMPEGHLGEQHVAMTTPDRTVVGVAPRNTAGDPIVEQPTREVLAERLATAVEVNDNLDRQLRETRDQLATVTASLRNAETMHDQLRRDVVDKAMELARRHDWCSVVQQGLTDMGLGDLLTQEYRVTATIRAERTVTLRVNATSGEEAWQMVDRMGSSEIADAYEEEHGESFDHAVMDGGDWEFQSADASTSTQRIGD